MDLKFSKVTRKGPVTIVTLSRPEVYNALHTDAHFELNKVFDDFSADPEQWVAIVTGAGDKAFCAGNDLKWQAAGGKRGWDKGGFAGLTSRFDCDKPIIAAVNGVAMGGGFEIALACDLIIASENATFALPEPRVGLAALAGGVHRLPRQIGLKRAMGMILTARHVGARKARNSASSTRWCRQAKRWPRPSAGPRPSARTRRCRSAPPSRRSRRACRCRWSRRYRSSANIPP